MKRGVSSCDGAKGLEDLPTPDYGQFAGFAINSLLKKQNIIPFKENNLCYLLYYSVIIIRGIIAMSLRVRGKVVMIIERGENYVQSIAGR
jgi:hypothetical protein